MLRLSRHCRAHLLRHCIVQQRSTKSNQTEGARILRIDRHVLDWPVRAILTSNGQQLDKHRVWNIDQAVGNAGEFNMFFSTERF